MNNTKIVVARNGDIEYGAYAEVRHEGAEWVAYNSVTGARWVCESKQGACNRALELMRYYARMERVFR